MNIEGKLARFSLSGPSLLEVLRTLTSHKPEGNFGFETPRCGVIDKHVLIPSSRESIQGTLMFRIKIFIQEVNCALTNDKYDTAIENVKIIIKQFSKHIDEVHQDTIKKFILNCPNQEYFATSVKKIGAFRIKAAVKLQFKFRFWLVQEKLATLLHRVICDGIRDHSFNDMVFELFKALAHVFYLNESLLGIQPPKYE